MPGSTFLRLRRGLARFLETVFGIGIGHPPVGLAERVAERLHDNLTLEQRMVLRRHFGVDYETIAALENIAKRNVRHRHTVRELESQALIRLYRWEQRKSRLPALQRRLARCVGKMHGEILDLLCDAPPIRPVLVGWHDQLVDGRRPAGEIADYPAAVPAGDPDEGPQMPELALAALLRKAIWAHARGCRAVRDPNGTPAIREGQRDLVRAVLHEARFNARSVTALAEALLGHARHMQFETEASLRPRSAAAEDAGVPAPSEDPAAADLGFDDIAALAEHDPLLAERIAAESGMTLRELWDRAGPVDAAMEQARRGLALLAASSMPILAELAEAPGIGGPEFYDRIGLGRAVLLRAADLFCYTCDGDFTVTAGQAIGQALADAPVAPTPPIEL